MSVEKQIEAVQAEDWFGCYDGQRGDLFTRESNRHPAKMAIGLCFRIFDHGEKMGYWKKGDLILDPMAGIGTTLICGAVLGYRMLGVELESHFIALAWGNIQRCAGRLCRDRDGISGAGRYFAATGGVPPFGIIQGDARHLAEFVQGGAAELSLRRPIFEGKSGGGINVKGYGPDGADKVGDRTYSARTVSGAVSSPPYGNQEVVQGAGVTHRILKIAREEGMAAAVRAYRVDVMDRQKAHGRWSDENIVRHIEMALASAETGGYAGAVSSPPYGDQDLTGQSHFRSRLDPDAKSASENPHEGYSGAVTSPPYADQMSHDSPGGIDWTKQKDGRTVPRPNSQGNIPNSYSGTVTSPPYSDAEPMHRNQAFRAPHDSKETLAVNGATPKGNSAQIGNLRDPKGDIDAVLTSPPFEDREAQKATHKFRDPEGFAEEQARRYQAGEMKGHSASAQAILKNMEEQSTVELSADSISRKNGETYLSAMLEVYRQLHIVLKPGGVVALVTKNPVKNKAIRRLDLDTIRLMEAAGFDLIERKRAMLAETVTHGDLFAGETTRKHERKSFFKRLYEKKNPHLAVDHEDVLFFRSV